MGGLRCLRCRKNHTSNASPAALRAQREVARDFAGTLEAQWRPALSLFRVQQVMACGRSHYAWACARENDGFTPFRPDRLIGGFNHRRRRFSVTHIVAVQPGSSTRPRRVNLIAVQTDRRRTCVYLSPERRRE